MNVRPAAFADVPQIAEVHVAGWQIGYRGLLPQPLLDSLTAADRLPRWAATLQQAAWPGQGTLVAQMNGAVVGFVDFGPARDSDRDGVQGGEIRSLYVAPTAWRHGIGRDLLAAATAKLAAAGHSDATLWVMDSNARAISFYGALGWLPDGTVKPDVVGGMTIHDRRLGRSIQAG